MTDECDICCDTYTQHRRKRIECGYCHAACCSACLQKYLLASQADAQCMACKHAFDGEFLAMHLPKTWLLGTYKAHRERVLLEREMAMLPATQDVLQNYKYAEQMRADVETMATEARVLQDRLRQINRHTATLRYGISFMQTNNYTQRPGQTSSSGSTRERRQFVRACPAADCRGFLSAAWKCGTCDAKVCKDCGEVLTEEEDHRCDPEVAASHALIQRETRPCPQCAVMIYKIDGCFGPDVPVRLWDGGVKLSQYVEVGDVLIGDDGTPRTVQHTFSGEDDMFRVDQTRGMTFEVNSKHTLLFKFSGEGVHPAGDRWKAVFLDRDNQKFSSKTFETKAGADAYFDGLGLEPQIEMRVDDYMRLPDSYKKMLVGYKSSGVESGFTVTPVGRGQYYGWAVDGNKRFVLEDFTCQRNCDQMFCTQCNVAFSWRTGTVVTDGVIHNPHYYEWMRRTRGEVPRTPGDVPCGGGLPHIRELEKIWGAATEVTVASIIDARGVYRWLRHMQGVEMPRLRQAANNDPNRNADLRLQYLLRRIEQDEWRVKLQQREKKRQHAQAVLQVYEMFVAAATDIFRSLATRQVGAQAGLDQLAVLQQFTNDSLKGIAGRFNMRVKRVRET